MSKIKNKQVNVSSNFDINNKKLINVSEPTINTDAATKNYVDISISGTSLQDVYNNSTTPEITTNSTNGAITIKRGSSSDFDYVLEILNGTNDTTTIINGSGNMRTTNMVLGKTDTGFAYPELVTEYYSRENRTVTISGSTLATWRGLPIIELVSGWVSPPHPTGKTVTQFLYYDGSSFVWSDIPWTMDMVLITACVYVNSTIGFIGIRECHGLMDPTSHSIAHTNIGTTLKSGGASSGIVLDSITSANRRPIIAQLVLQDEDLLTTNPSITNSLYTQLHITDTNTVNVVENATDIIEVNGTVPYYSSLSGTIFTKTPFPNHGYGSVWRLDIPVTSDTESQRFRSIFIMPQSISVGGGSSANASALAEQLALDPALVKLGTFQSTEYRLGWQYVIRYSTTIGSNWAIVGEQAIAGSKAKPVSVQGSSGISSVSHDTNFIGAGTPTDPLKLANLVTLKPAVSNTDSVFEVANLSNTVTSSIKGDGTISTTNLLASGATINGDVSIYGNFFISGTTTTVDVDNVTIKDNLLLLNKGEVGNGVSLTYSGIEIDRGSATNYQIVFNETDDKLYAGLIGSLNQVGTVTSVGGTGTVSGLSLSGTVTSTGNLTLGGTLQVTPSNFASQTANTVLIAPNGSNGVPTFRLLSENDIPSLSWNKITTNKPTTLSGYGITDAQPLNTNLTSLSSLAYTSGSFVKMTAANTFTLDTNTYSLSSHTHYTASALTRTNDTNVTLTLGGTPTTALLQAVSLTLGWTGTLADSRITSASNWNTAFGWGNHAGLYSLLGHTHYTASALTKVDDTNVTLTLGGTPSTALLQATSLTLGWTGTLADSRISSASVWNSKQAGSTNLTSLSSLTYASASFVKMTGANTFTLDTNTYSLSSHTHYTASALTRTNDTNVTLTLGGTPTTALLQAVSLTLGWTGTLADARIASASNWNTAYGWGNHAGLYLGISAKAADSELLDGRDGANYIYGQNSSGSNTTSATQNVYELPQYKSGFWEANGANWTPDTSWWWGGTFAHTSNSGSYNYSGQIAFQNSGGGGNVYLRTISAGTPSGWSRIWTGANFDPSGYSTTSHTHTFASLTSKPTTLSGYGITDAYTKTESDTKFVPIGVVDGSFNGTYLTYHFDLGVKYAYIGYNDTTNEFVSHIGTLTHQLTTGAGSIRAGAYIKQGGTSAQFLKADGTIDTTAYQPLNAFLTDIASYATAPVAGFLYKDGDNSITINTTSFQTLDADLTSIAGLGFTSTSFLKKTAANTWALDTNTYSLSSHSHSYASITFTQPTVETLMLNFESATPSGIAWDPTNNYMLFKYNNVTMFRFDSNGTLHADGDIIAYSSTISDIRLKKDIKLLDSVSSLDKIMKLQSISYKNNNTEDDDIHMGYIAQDVEKIIPNIVIERDVLNQQSSTGLYKTIRYQEIIPVLTEALKEQQKQINSQQKEINELKDSMKLILQKLDKKIKK